MTQITTPPSRTVTSHEVDQYLRTLKLAFIAEHYGELGQASRAQAVVPSRLSRSSRRRRGPLRQDRATKTAFAWPAFRSLKPWSSFAGTGPRRLTAPRSNITSP